MTEIEVKILDINPEDIRKKLLDAGAKRTFHGELIAKVFDFPDLRMKNADGHLRLRKIGDKTELTYKEAVKSEKFKKRIETEVIVSDFDTAEKILRKIGLRETRSYRKTRESYQLGNISFDIDIYPEETGIPPLVEIESTEEGIKEGVKLLGFQTKDTTTVSGWKLLDIYKDKIGRNALEGD